MKKFLFGFLALVLFTSFSFAQSDATSSIKTVKGYSICFDFGTIANSGQETGYVDLRDWQSIDSVTVSLSASNETDIDTVNFWVGNWTNDGFISDASAGVLYQASTLDVAASATDFLNLVTTNATRLSKANLRGATGVKFQIEAQSSGNDATDPNALYIVFRIFGTKL